MDLGLDRNDPRQSMGAFRDACQRRVDYATVNGRMFINNVSLGVYAAIVHDDSYRDAKVETTMNLLPELIGRHAAPSDLRFVTSDGNEVDAAIAVVVSNNTYTMRGTAVSVNRRHLDRGELGVIAATTLSPFWHEFTATEFEVQSRSDVVLAGIDGEPVELATPLRFETHPGGLVMLVPLGNVEAAQRRSSRDAQVRDLIEVALGREPRR
jgi:diacylglycerol kinase family enzyme